MPRSSANPRETLYTFKLGGRKLSLSYARAFALGDSLFGFARLKEAAVVFKALSRRSDRGPRAKIMLAQCEAGLKHFEACSEILEAAFEGESKPIAEELHSAFVFQKLGFRDDAIRALGNLSVKFEGLPTLCLVLGDLFAEKGNHKKATTCWRLAIKRDLLRGGVAMSARRRLKAIVKGTSNDNKADRPLKAQQSSRNSRSTRRVNVNH